MNFLRRIKKLIERKKIFLTRSDLANIFKKKNSLSKTPEDETTVILDFS